MIWYLVYAGVCAMAWAVDMFVTRLGFFRSYPLESYFLVLCGGGALIFEFSQRPGLRVFAFLVVGLLAGGSFLYESLIHARYRGLPGPPLSEGDASPEFSLAVPPEGSFERADLEGGPTLIVYHRGSTCPFAVSQLALLTGQRGELSGVGIEQVVVVSHEPPERVSGVGERLPTGWLAARDGGAGFARQFGLQHPQRADKIAPAAFLFDRDGTLLWQQRARSYRSPPHPVWIRMVAGRLLAQGD